MHLSNIESEVTHCTHSINIIYTIDPLESITSGHPRRPGFTRLNLTLFRVVAGLPEFIALTLFLLIMLLKARPALDGSTDSGSTRSLTADSVDSTRPSCS